jgi:hypothetical protein
MVDSHRLMKKSDRMLLKLMKQMKQMKRRGRFMKLKQQMKMMGSLHKARIANIKRKMLCVKSSRNSLDFYYPVF